MEIIVPNKYDIESCFKLVKFFTDFKINNLKPGTYNIRVILDRNKNDKWDHGNYNKRTLSEEIIFSTSEIKLKANWDIKGITIK